MARIRSIRPDFWRDPRIGRCSRDARLLLLAMVSHADDAGRIIADPRRLRADAFGFDDLPERRVAELLEELRRARMVAVYESEGVRMCALPFSDPCSALHQRIRAPTDSRLPSPPPEQQQAALPGISPVSTASLSQRRGKNGADVSHDDDKPDTSFHPGSGSGSGRGGGRGSSSNAVALQPHPESENAAPVSGLDRVIAAWADGYEWRYGRGPAPPDRRDRSDLGQVLRSRRPSDCPPDRWVSVLCRAIGRHGYLADSRVFLLEQCHLPRFFCTDLNKYIGGLDYYDSEFAPAAVAAAPSEAEDPTPLPHVADGAE